ncbi:MAG TPA: peptidoglycan-binding domain-containing protein [Planctomycetota bacterium]|nr:peptidoglycan-binding domain-containing protein [Planctomycetota bacterium]
MPEAAIILSGPLWVREFPTSRSTRDLVSPFRENVDRFLAALEAAGVTILIEATLRPPARAHLMHYAWRIAREDLDPRSIPVHPGIPIDWCHRDSAGQPCFAAAFAAAQAMVEAYDIVYRPAVTSVHCEGRAIDLTLTWPGDIEVKDTTGRAVAVRGSPRNCNHPTLHAIGATYGVLKLVRDTPHWSDNGR